MLKETGSIWVVKYQEKQDESDEFETFQSTSKERFAETFHSAIKIADDMLEDSEGVNGSNFAEICNRYILQKSNKRVIIKEEEVEDEL